MDTSRTRTQPPALRRCWRWSSCLSLCWDRTCQQTSGRCWSSSGTPPGLGIPGTQPASIRCQLWALTLLEHGQRALWTPSLGASPACLHMSTSSETQPAACERCAAFWRVSRTLSVPSGPPSGTQHTVMSTAVSGDLRRAGQPGRQLRASTRSRSSQGPPGSGELQTPHQTQLGCIPPAPDRRRSGTGRLCILPC